MEEIVVYYDPDAEKENETMSFIGPIHLQDSSLPDVLIKVRKPEEMPLFSKEECQDAKEVCEHTLII